MHQALDAFYVAMNVGEFIQSFIEIPNDTEIFHFKPATMDID